jgi:hypothetical protein
VNLKTIQYLDFRYKAVDTSFVEMLLQSEFTLNFSAIFVGSLYIRASRKFFLNEVRSPEIVFIGGP